MKKLENLFSLNEDQPNPVLNGHNLSRFLIDANLPITKKKAQEIRSFNAIGLTYKGLNSVKDLAKEIQTVDVSGSRIVYIPVTSNPDVIYFGLEMLSESGYNLTIPYSQSPADSLIIRKDFENDEVLKTFKEILEKNERVIMRISPGDTEENQMEFKKRIHIGV